MARDGNRTFDLLIPSKQLNTNGSTDFPEGLKRRNWAVLGEVVTKDVMTLLQNVVQTRRVSLTGESMVHGDRLRFSHTSDEIYASAN
jgi:hypothetical protein